MIANIFLKSALCSVVYVLAVLFGGAFSAFVGLKFPNLTQNMSLLMLMLFLSGMLLSFCIGLVLAKLNLDPLKSFFAVFTLLFVNVITQLIEGVFFCAGSIQIDHIPALFLQQFLACLIFSLVSVLVLKTSTSRKYHGTKSGPFFNIIPRFLVSAGSYVFLYYIIGRLFYTLFTSEYYAQGLSGLSLPNDVLILVIEVIRAILLTLSILPIILFLEMTRGRSSVTVGVLLSVVGGINPMLQQVGSMPTKFLFASGIEMTLQFFFTGIISVYLLNPRKKAI